MSWLNLTFFSEDTDFVDQYRKHLVSDESISFDFCPGTIGKILDENTIHILVASGCCMNCVNESHEALFPDIQQRVWSRIDRCSQTQTKEGTKALPIGSCVLVPTGNPDVRLLALSPVMMFPDETQGNIGGTFNVYWAMRGLLKMLGELKTSNSAINVAVPCFGADPINKMTSEESAGLVAAAVDDHLRGNVAVCDPNCPEGSVKVLDGLKWAYVLSGHASEPVVSDNS